METIEIIREEIESALLADDFECFGEESLRRKARGVYEELARLDDRSLVQETHEAGFRWASGSPVGIEILFGGKVAAALAAIEEVE